MKQILFTLLSFIKIFVSVVNRKELQESRKVYHHKVSVIIHLEQIEHPFLYLSMEQLEFLLKNPN